MLFNELLLITQTLFPKDIKLLERIKNLNINQNISQKDLKEIIHNPLKKKKISDFHNKEFSKLQKEIKQEGINLLYISESSYPEILKKEFGSPLVLFYRGDISVLNSKIVSIVGSRKPTLYGRKYANMFSERLASYGIVIVSGMARGIDTEAHKGALKKGKTAAILGSGLKKIYPASNKKLFHKIIENGCVISEFAPSYPTLASNFPIRNRIIAYISPLTLVIEAKIKSGSLITAYLANDIGRDVAAIPGNIDSKASEGTNYLIKKGAFLVQNIDDLSEILPYKIKKHNKSEIMISKKEKEILELIPDNDIINFDSIVEKRSNYSIGEIFQILLQLELKGLIYKIQGNNYQKKEMQ